MKDLCLINSCNMFGRKARHISHCIMSNRSLLQNVPVWLVKSSNGVFHHEEKKKHRKERGGDNVWR